MQNFKIFWFGTMLESMRPRRKQTTPLTPEHLLAFFLDVNDSVQSLLLYFR
jgi:hypothetical protein